VQVNYVSSNHAHDENKQGLNNAMMMNDDHVLKIRQQASKSSNRTDIVGMEREQQSMCFQD
jgi:hypothetical protein